jgi:hypothetical protein
MSDRGGWEPYRAGGWYHPEHGVIERISTRWFWYPPGRVWSPECEAYPTLTAAIDAVRKMTEAMP